MDLDRIPKTICRNLVDSFDKKIEMLIQRNGERVNRRKLGILKSNYTWKNKWNEDNNYKTVYN